MPRGIPNADLSMYGIVRLPKDSGLAWFVSLRRHRQKYSACFRDKRYGGKDAALSAALAYRDKVVSETQTLTRRQFATIVRVTNISGIPGVRRIQKKPPYAYWTAETQLPDGRKLHRTFSVNLLGEEGARQSAIEERLRQLEQVTGLHCFSPAAIGTGEEDGETEDNHKVLCQPSLPLSRQQ